jgi:hypothetical protein
LVPQLQTELSEREREGEEDGINFFQEILSNFFEIFDFFCQTLQALFFTNAKVLFYKTYTIQIIIHQERQ